MPGRLIASSVKERVQQGRLRVTPDFAPLGSTMMRVEVREGGQLRLRANIPNTGWAEFEIDQTVCEVFCTTYGDYEYTNPLAGNVQISNGQSAFGDEIGFFPINGTSPTALSAVELFTQDVPYLRFVNETLALGGIGEMYCTGTPNSTGNVATLKGMGSVFVADQDVTLMAADLPPNVFGFFVVSQMRGFVPNAGGSDGNLCIIGSTGRYNAPGQILNSGVNGSFSLALDLNAVPQPSSLVAVTPGDRWYFQAWNRDVSPNGPSSNFTRGLCIEFE